MELKQIIQVKHKENDPTVISRVSLITNTYEDNVTVCQTIGDTRAIPCRGFSPVMAGKPFDYTYSIDINDATRWEKDEQKYFASKSGYFGSIKMVETQELKAEVAKMQTFVEKHVMAVVDKEHPVVNEAMDKDEGLRDYINKFIRLFNNVEPIGKQTLHQTRFQDCTFKVDEKKNGVVVKTRTDYSFYVTNSTKFYIGDKEIPREKMYMKSFNAKLVVGYPMIHFIIENGRFKKFITKIPIVKVYVFPSGIKERNDLTDKIAKMDIPKKA